MASKKSSRTIVGVPLSPSVLRDLGAMRKIPPKDDSQIRTYRVWTCHGYRKSGNVDEGFLKLERWPAKNADRPMMQMKVEQQIVNDRGQTHVQRADIVYRADRIAPIDKWRLSSRFVSPEGRDLPELAVKEQDGAGRYSPPGVTSDWTLFDAATRWPFEKKPPLKFDLLEELSILRPGHRLSYRGAEPFEIGGQKIRLHRFQQLGHGLLPYDYWLDDGHRLLFVTTFARAYILDPEAEAKTAKTLKAKGGAK